MAGGQAEGDGADQRRRGRRAAITEAVTIKRDLPKLKAGDVREVTGGESLDDEWIVTDTCQRNRSFGVSGLFLRKLLVADAELSEVGVRVQRWQRGE